jgi:metallo-beta-lactamase family protein
MKLSFLGGVGTVTGSRYLLHCGERRILVDCGLYQGYKQLRLKNWAAPVFDPRSIDAVVLTHAHIDHSGYLPLLVKLGFKGRIYATPATEKLCRILLPDSGFLQEEQAKFANRHGFSKHSPALPLYTQEDAERCLPHFSARDFAEPFEIGDIGVRFSHAGHLLGAASVRIEHQGDSVLFSGDLGRANDPLMKPPEPPPAANHVVIESTYGDRLHPHVDPMSELGVAVRTAHARGGVLIVPTFAVGRAQLLMLLLSRLKARKEIPDVPIYLDSPMAIDATPLYKEFRREHRLSAAECEATCHAARLVHTADESKGLDDKRGTSVILAASGMATGGRVVHHLKRFAPDPKNVVLLAGFQAGGTRGASLAAGAKQIRIHGQSVPVNAQVIQLSTTSAHADADELLAWLRAMPNAPKTVFVTHGEPAASDALRQRIEAELRWNAVVPEYRDQVGQARGRI